MARGQAQAATNQLNTTNQLGAQQGAQASSLESTLIPSYTDMLNSGYNTPAQAAAATESGMGAVNTSFNNDQQQLNNESARTNNPASLTAGQDQLALERGTALGTEANNLAEQQFNNELKGASGLQGLYNTNQSSANSMYGLGPSTLGARAAGTSPWSIGVGPVNFKS
jgi:hypothetical protein